MGLQIINPSVIPLPAVSAQSTPSNPTGTTSATAVMMGLAIAITPLVTGSIIAWLSGAVANSVISDGITVQLRYGTGTAPINGAAVTGTLLGAAVSCDMAAAAQRIPVALQGRVAGLTLGTAYWIDVALLAVTGGTATITGISATTLEI